MDQSLGAAAPSPQLTLLREMFTAAVNAADPMLCVPVHLPPKPEGRVVVIGAGKASARMAEAVEAAWGPCEGYVITRYGYERPCAQIEIVQAAHPVPDQNGEAATRTLLSRVAPLDQGDFVLSLISGGGSALLCAPAGDITLDEKRQLTADLLASGAPIGVMNGIRKQISAVKGGKLAAAVYPATLLSLMISDVPGNAPGDIASGPTVGDIGDAQSALNALARWNVTPAPSIKAYLESGGAPVSPDDPRLSTTQNVIIAAPAQSLTAAANIAKGQGFSVRILGDALEGEARDLAAEHAALALQIQSELAPGDAPVVLLSGGECTVTRRGEGVGGPNAEYTLALACALNEAPRLYAIACDTDGVDGAAEVAGATCDPTTLARATAKGVNAHAALNANDAHTFFEKLGDQVVPGPTLTNVNDFRAILIEPRPAA